MRECVERDTPLILSFVTFPVMTGLVGAGNHAAKRMKVSAEGNRPINAEECEWRERAASPSANK
jgi:hypothetical protein